MEKTALITGVTGQDGSYLAELLLEKGYRRRWHGASRQHAQLHRIEHIMDRLTLVQGDLLDQVSLIQILRKHRPQEVYNLAASRSCPPRGSSPCSPPSSPPWA